MRRPSFRFLRFLRSRKFWQRSVFALACLITLVAAAYAIENYRGRLAWEEYRHEATARGAKLKIEELIKPPIPDEENFAAIPLFQEHQSADPQVRERATKVARIPFHSDDVAFGSLGGRYAKEPLDFEDWRKIFLAHKLLDSPTDNAASDVLRALDRYEPVLTQLHAAARERPGNRLNAGWEKGMNADFLRMPSIFDLTRLLSLRTAALLAVGRSEEALENWKVSFRLCEMLQGEPSLLAAMSRVMMLFMTIAPVWEGLAAHQWTAAHLTEIDAALRKIDLATDYTIALEGERALVNRALESYMAARNIDLFSEHVRLGIELVPRGWIHQNLVRLNQWFDQVIAQSREPYLAQDMIEYRPWQNRPWWKWPYTFVLDAAVWPLSDNQHVAMGAQAEIELCRVACAIERHYLRTGTPPARLEDLVPADLDQLPRDLFSGAPLRYVPRAEGGALLYSVGSDRKDDGGSEENDKVWLWKPTPPETQ